VSGLLSRIESYKRAEIAAAKLDCPVSVLEDRAASAPAPRGFGAAIRRHVERGEYALIAEVKKASPSKGLIREDFDPASHAAAYERGGAVCVSVLTDAPSFQGAPGHLAAARAACTLPALRKDFMFDPYQVVESRAWGADCILIILAAVDDITARDLEDTATALHMDVLLEIHDEAELGRALRLRSPLIGINNRNLSTFHTSLTTSERLAPKIPSDRVIIAESGIDGPEDLAFLANAGISAFLVGESLMRSPDVERATASLLKSR